MTRRRRRIRWWTSVVGDRDDGDLVRGQQPETDRFGEREVINDRAEEVLVVHGGHADVSLLGTDAIAGREDCRGGRHEQAPLGRDRVGVQDRLGRASLEARAAVRLVGDRQIEGSLHPGGGHGLRQDAGGIVGAEDQQRAAVGQSLGDPAGVGRAREGQLVASRDVQRALLKGRGVEQLAAEDVHEERDRRFEVGNGIAGMIDVPDGRYAAGSGGRLRVGHAVPSLI